MRTGADRLTVVMHRRILVAFGLSLLASFWVVSCHREPPPSPVKESALSSPGAAPSKPAVKGPESFRLAPGRVVAIGDLHGDLRAAINAFRLAGVIDETEKWVGGNAAVVQTGDVLDRGDEERPLFEWLDKIEERAKASGGALYRLNGNHEIMNVAGDLRYVTASGFSAFGDLSQGSLPARFSRAPERAKGRLLAFLPGGSWARKLSQYPEVLVVGDSVFAHGGLRLSHVEYGIERMNAEFSAWMRGDAELPAALQGDDTPFWVRDFGDNVTAADCAALNQALERLKVVRLVVGHTPQKDGISFACDGKVVRIDVGLSAYYGGRSATVLEIRDGKATILDSAPKP